MATPLFLLSLQTARWQHNIWCSRFSRWRHWWQAFATIMYKGPFKCYLRLTQMGYGLGLQKGKAKGRLTLGAKFETLWNDFLSTWSWSQHSKVYWTTKCIKLSTLEKSYGLLKLLGLANVNGCTFSLILSYNNSPTEQLSLIKEWKNSIFLMMIWIGIPLPSRVNGFG